MQRLRAEILLAVALGAQAAPQQAPLTLVEPAPFLRLDSTPEAWQRSSGTQAADWRLLDANGQRIPFARLPEDPEAAPAATWRAVRLFALPPPPAPASQPIADPAGHLLDLGKPLHAERLRLRWAAGNPPFQAGLRLQTSPDLQQWRELGRGQLLSLAAPDGSRIEQQELPLPAAPERYLRLLWDDPARAVRLQAAELQERAGAAAPAPKLALQKRALPPPDAEGALLLDLGGPQRLRSLRLLSSGGTWVLPLQLQTRLQPGDPWRTQGTQLFYRVQRADGSADLAAPLSLDRSAAQLRLLPPPGAALPAGLEAEWQLLLPGFVWAAQGQPPYRLEVGSRAADAGPRPLHEVVPDWTAERSRLGRAEIGAFVPLPEPVAAGPTPQQRQALLWAVLGLGVAGLGLAAWKLLRQGHADTAKREDPGA